MQQSFMQNGDLGFMLLDASFTPVAANDQAVRILAFPTAPAHIPHIESFLADKLRTDLMVRTEAGASFVTEFRSDKRRYTCSAFCLDGRLRSSLNGSVVLLLLQRPAKRRLDLTQISTVYNLTPRERESVELLAQGLTTKEIARRMAVSPSTIGAFLRLVMVKLGTTSRSGIVSKVALPPS